MGKLEIFTMLFKGIVTCITVCLNTHESSHVAVIRGTSFLCECLINVMCCAISECDGGQHSRPTWQVSPFAAASWLL